MTDVLVIGIDGLSVPHYEELKENGVIPNLSGLIEDSAWGELRSTVPPQTPPAWISFITGKNPGKHGIFGFSKVDEGTGERAVYSYSDVATEDMFDYLEAEGKTVGAMNIPFTYPPHEVDGFLISGFPTEGIETFTYPAELGEELQAEGYKVRVQDEDDEDEYVDVVRQRGETMRRLLRERDPDVFVGVFKENENAHHQYWEEPLLERIYAAMDEEIGKLLEMV
ncbi:MAG: alkaline phosphatase family protein, partial [Candidatus Nanohaloarchaea archaeon]